MLYRRQDIGRRLILAGLDAARQSGLEQVELEVRTETLAEIALHEKNGFAITGTTPRALKVDGEYFGFHSMALVF